MSLPKLTNYQVLHLLRLARLRLDAVQRPHSFEQIIQTVTGIAPVNGLTYRNSALLMLLNIPLFVNFLRNHRPKTSATACEVQNCLTCALRELAGRYWTIATAYLSADQCRGFVDALVKVWRICRTTFWGNSKDVKQKIGPEDDDTEYSSDVFLTHLLQEMERQLANVER